MAALEIRWLLCDLVTGRVLTELPIAGVDQIQRVIAREDNQTFSLAPADPSCPDDWYAMLTPGKTMLVLELDGAPAQAWHVEDRVVGAATVAIPAVSLETCLHRTNVPDLSPIDLLDDAEGCAQLCAPLVDRFGFLIDHTPTGHTSEFDYSNAEDRNLLDVMNERTAGENPIEWRIALRWEDDATKQVVTKVLEIRGRIGIDRVDAVFDLGPDGRGCVESYSRNDSYAQGKGATMLIGTSEGTGTSRPVTDPVFSDLIGLGWPTWEERSNFSGLPAADSVEEEDAALLARTIARLAQRENGTVSWTLVASDTAPRPGVDYIEGDTVHIDVAPQQGQRGDGSTYWLDPVGGTASMRVLGWTLNLASRQTALIAWEDGDDS